MAGGSTRDFQVNQAITEAHRPGASQESNEAPLKSQDYAKSMLRLEVATYISQMSAELSTMARNSDMPLLSYFLDMASAEARATDDSLRDSLRFGSEPDTGTTLPQA